MTKAPNPTMNGPCGYVKIPAPPYEACPHCGEMNTDKKERVWRVADERGLHGECDVCAHAWTS